MVMSKISVIVPAYNSGEKIRECLDSIINQTHRDLEIILVDDCSSDDTFQIMQEYADRDSRIHIMRNKINCGAGFSRNRGLDIATGEYVTFVDSDDFLDLDTYEKANAAIEKENPDIVRFKQNSFLDMGRLRVSLDFFTNNVFNDQVCILNPKNNHEYVALESPGVCNKIFRRELIGDLRFIEGKKWEDYPFCTLLLGKADKVVIIDGGRYNYRHSLNFDNTTLGDVKKPSSRMLEIYDCCDFLESEYRENDLFDTFEGAVRSNQKIHSLQRVRDVMFSRTYQHDRKKAIINALINLTEVKYGEPFNDEIYLSLKRSKLFYNARMSIVEKVYSDESLRRDGSEQVIRDKIKKLV